MSKAYKFLKECSFRFYCQIKDRLAIKKKYTRETDKVRKPASSKNYNKMKLNPELLLSIDDQLPGSILENVGALFICGKWGIFQGQQ